MAINHDEPLALSLAVPPGETLAEILEDRAMSQRELSKRTGLSTKHISQIVTGKAPLTPETALKLEHVLGIEAEFWLRLEAIYQASLARMNASAISEEEKQIAESYPYAEMARNCFVEATKSIDEKVRNLRDYFHVASLLLVPGIQDAAFRMAQPEKVDQFALAAWIQRALNLAEGIEVEPFSMTRLGKILPELRSLTTLRPSAFCPTMKNLCASAGIAVVFVKHLKGTRVNGATLWPQKDKAVIALTDRGEYSDTFWFTFFHEVGHILDGRRHAISINYESRISGDSNDDEEQQADKFARDWLIPPTDYFDFLLKYDLSSQAIIRFANSISVTPQIVAGRLAHDKHISWARAAGFRKTAKYRIAQPNK